MKVRVFGTLRAVMGGTKEIELPVGNQSTVLKVLGELVTAYPGLKEKLFREGETLQGGVTVVVNGRSVRFLDGLNTPIRETDELALFPPIGGG